MILVKPSSKPSNPNFSSGPCSKRPGWDISVLKNSQISRSHRSKECKKKLNEVIVKSKQILKLQGNKTGNNTKSCNFTKNLRIGSQGEDVKDIQRFLKKQGFFNHPYITSYYGPVTDKAVRAFQAKYADEILKPLGLTSPTGN